MLNLSYETPVENWKKKIDPTLANLHSLHSMKHFKLIFWKFQNISYSNSGYQTIVFQYSLILARSGTPLSFVRNFGLSLDSILFYLILIFLFQIQV